MRIAPSTIVVNRLHSRNSDGNFGQSLAPGPAKTVADDYRNRDSQSLLHFLMQAGCGAIRIFWKKQRVFAAVHIGNIDPAVGANKPVMGFGDENAILPANYPLALLQREFGYSRVQFVAPRPDSRFGRRLDRVQPHQLALGFRNHFMLHHQNVACGKFYPLPFERKQQFFRKRVSWLEFVRQWEGDDPQLWHGLLVRSQRIAAEIPPASEVLCASFAGKLGKLPKVRWI